MREWRRQFRLPLPIAEKFLPFRPASTADMSDPTNRDPADDAGTTGECDELVELENAYRAESRV